MPRTLLPEQAEEVFRQIINRLERLERHPVLNLVIQGEKGQGYLDLQRQTVDPPTPQTDRARIFLDQSGGKYRVRVKWPSGVVTTMLTEP